MRIEDDNPSHRIESNRGARPNKRYMRHTNALRTVRKPKAHRCPYQKSSRHTFRLFEKANTPQTQKSQFPQTPISREGRYIVAIGVCTQQIGTDAMPHRKGSIHFPTDHPLFEAPSRLSERLNTVSNNRIAASV
mmetsp:Transcript_19990/g.41345  ORF Transcript_19990/g.41345 Transcript_19990/m.41345 type:complete len:134 (+) Transcript_19990:246-647(+)